MQKKNFKNFYFSLVLHGQRTREKTVKGFKTKFACVKVFNKLRIKSSPLREFG